MLKLSDNNIIGLTGMSGAGKSIVCRFFKESGYTVIDCDLCSREVVAAGSDCLKEFSVKLSPEIINADGTLNRSTTAKLIFSDNEKREIFNKIIYPYITYNVIEKIKAAKSDILLDAPTLFEARLEGICSHIVSVCADLEQCENRIIMRDGISRELAAARLSAQHGIDFFKSHSDFCIINNSSEEELFMQVLKIIISLKGKP